ncbi:hypothetical protein ACA910_005147 [Epithemia clementina (nom. ined.)]
MQWHAAAISVATTTCQKKKRPRGLDETETFLPSPENVRDTDDDHHYNNNDNNYSYGGQESTTTHFLSSSLQGEKKEVFCNILTGTPTKIVVVDHGASSSSSSSSLDFYFWALRLFYMNGYLFHLAKDWEDPSWVVAVMSLLLPLVHCLPAPASWKHDCLFLAFWGLQLYYKYYIKYFLVWPITAM